MDHAEIEAFLADPATHGGAPVEVVRTHAALVFLAGDSALKIKRPVTYDYLDFSRPETRRAMLEREIALNAPAATEIYGAMVPITREADGRLALGGTGAPVEWALRMRRFPAAAELSRVAASGGLDAGRDGGLAARLGAAVAAYHRAAPRRDEDGAALIREILDELGRVLAGMPDTFPLDRTAGFGAAAGRALDALAPLLRARARAGFVRRCHGDLHLGNIVLIGDRPVPFDALEFDERLGTMDVLYDLAFLIMDLRHRGLDAAANVVMNRWLQAMAEPAHLDGLAALPLFLSVRAAIRAMVAGQRAAGAADAAAALAEARAYLAAAEAYLAPAPAQLVAVGGLSGSGKSTLGAALAPELGRPPGAVHLRSDLIRKRLAGVAETDRLPPASYTPESATAVYAALRAEAARALAAGQSVVLDAVHLRPEERAGTAAVAAAAGVDFAGFWLDAPAEVLIARVDARLGDASDADGAVVRRQLDWAGAAAPGDGWQRLDASGSPGPVLQAARAFLGRSPA
jgi:aminoglycoside phosphotransferase family enzyme/predicted kinase